MKHARKRRHILYFDDLLGLFQSGKSSSSNLSMGDLLKAAIEEGGLRLVAEATPEAWARLQESQRGFTELFRIERLAEPDDAGTLRILSRCAQALEAERGCRFEPGAVPLAADLARRYMRGTAFPGKAAELLRQLAAGADGGAVGEAQVYAMFERRTGIGPRFLDPAHGMDRGEAEAFFHRRIAAQDEAVAAMADAAVLAKAQLDDPGRPVASLLFLGPTGVGKTECAKALAEFFFGSPERLTRFDMNEFSGPDAALRLIGVLGGAQGQLTGALRRNPYSVVLLDEIEKAHPEVFDLLLQVLGEGRLTDANGFSANFCNAIIVLTSNLGARSARRKLGFGPGGGANAAAYREAAEKFFRPELFNRIDRIIPFAELERDAIEWLARGLAQRALGRLGVVRRRLMLQIDPGVYPALADAKLRSEIRRARAAPRGGGAPRRTARLGNRRAARRRSGRRPRRRGWRGRSNCRARSSAPPGAWRWLPRRVPRMRRRRLLPRSMRCSPSWTSGSAPGIWKARASRYRRCGHITTVCAKTWRRSGGGAMRCSRWRRTSARSRCRSARIARTAKPSAARRASIARTRIPLRCSPACIAPPRPPSGSPTGSRKPTRPTR
ncbi:MAG: AAA family ATPase [Verrucomicrobiales bacterium]